MNTKLILGALLCVFVGVMAYAYYTRPAAPAPAATTDTSSASSTPIAQDQTPPAASGYTMAQVATHNSAASCWAVVDGKVYNLTSWISNHPGGQQAILSLCGKDGTAAFQDQHGGDSKPTAQLAKFLLGPLAL